MRTGGRASEEARKGKRKAGGACEVHPREPSRVAAKRSHMACMGVFSFRFETAELAVLYCAVTFLGRRRR